MTTRIFFVVFAVITLMLTAQAQKFQHVFDVNALTQSLKSSNTSTRLQAVQQLGVLGDPSATEALLPLLRSESPDVRREVVKTLTVLRDGRAIQALYTAYYDKDMESLRPEIITAAGNTHDDLAVSFLLRTIYDDNPLVRSAAFKALKKFYDPRINDALLPFLVHDDKEGKILAIEVFSRTHDPRALDIIIRMLSDKDDAIRLAATTAMVCYRDAKAVPALIKVLQDDKEKPIRTQAAYALGFIKDTRAVEPLLAMLREYKFVNDANYQVSIDYIDSIFFALGAIGDKRAIQPLIDVKNIDLYSRSRSLMQFGDIVNPMMIETLKFKKQKAGNSGLEYEKMRQSVWYVRDVRDFILTSTAFENMIDKRQNVISGLAYMMLRESRSIRGGAGYGLQAEDRWYIAFSARTQPRIAVLQGPLVNDYIMRRMSTYEKNKILDGSTSGDYEDTYLFAGKVCSATFLDSLLDKFPSMGSNSQTKRFACIAVSQFNDERAVPLMISSYDDKLTIKEGGYYLRLINDVHDLTPLLTLLKDKDKEARKAGAISLATIGDARAVQPLIDVLTTEKEADVRECVAEVLGIIGDKRALPALKKATTDPVEWARSAAQWAIGEIGDPNLKDTVNNSVMDNIRNYTRVGKSLLQLGDTRGNDFLVQALKSTDKMSLKLAVHGLSYGKSPVQHYILRTAVNNGATAEQALMEMCAAPQPGDASVLLDMLQEKNSGYTRMIVNAQGETMSYGLFIGAQSAYKRKIVDALGETGDKRVIPTLHSIMVNSTMDDEIIAAAGALIKLGEEKEAVPMLLEKLAARNKEKLNSVIIALAEAKDTAIIEPLAGKLTDDDPLTVAIAARALALHGDKRGNEAILRVLNMDEEELVLRAAAKFAGEVKDPRFVTPLVKLTQTGKLYVRLEAADSLGKIGGKDAVAALTAMLKDERSRLREAGALGLMATKDKSAIPALKDALKSETATKVQDAIKAALKAIG